MKNFLQTAEKMNVKMSRQMFGKLHEAKESAFV